MVAKVGRDHDLDDCWARFNKFYYDAFSTFGLVLCIARAHPTYDHEQVVGTADASEPILFSNSFY